MRDSALDGSLRSIMHLRGFSHLNPHEVRAAYEALARETIAQYEAILSTGVQFELPAGDEPRNQIEAFNEITKFEHHLLAWLGRT